MFQEDFFLCSAGNLCEDFLFALSHLLLPYLCTSFALLRIKHKKKILSFFTTFSLACENAKICCCDGLSWSSSDVETMTMKNSDESFGSSPLWRVAAFSEFSHRPKHTKYMNRAEFSKCTNLDELKLINNSMSVPFDVTRRRILTPPSTRLSCWLIYAIRVRSRIRNPEKEAKSLKRKRRLPSSKRANVIMRTNFSMIGRRANEALVMLEGLWSSQNSMKISVVVVVLAHWKFKRQTELSTK